jgi:hypothetical protein
MPPVTNSENGSQERATSFHPPRLLWVFVIIGGVASLDSILVALHIQEQSYIIKQTDPTIEDGLVHVPIAVVFLGCTVVLLYYSLRSATLYADRCELKSLGGTRIIPLRDILALNRSGPWNTVIVHLHSSIVAIGGYSGQNELFAELLTRWQENRESSE